MFEELIERYSQYSDTELINAYSNKNSYTQEAQKALEIEIKNRGGLESLKVRYNSLIEKENEKIRISKEAGVLYTQGFTKNDINSRINSELLPSEEIREIIEVSCNKIEASRKDEEIKPATFIGSITGGIIGGNHWRYIVEPAAYLFRTHFLSFCYWIGDNFLWCYKAFHQAK